MDVRDTASAINAIDNLESYMVLPEVRGDSDLGYYYIEEAGIYDLESMGSLTRYIDYESFGRDVRMEEGSYFTDQGYVCMVDNYSEQYQGLSDIPGEYKVTGGSKEYLRTTELDTEEGYSHIDGVRNNLKPERDESKGKSSVRESLQEKKEEVSKSDQEKPLSKSKDTDLER